MTQYILFLIVILIGAAYAVRNGNKAKAKIEKLTSAGHDYESKQSYLDLNVFHGLENLNSGFDSESVKYFSGKDFKVVLKRVEDLKLGIMGIEPWLDGAFYGVVVVEDFGNDPFNPKWYNQAFENFEKENVNLLYGASYAVPLNLL